MPRPPAGARSSSAPASSTAATRGIVGDLLKDAANSLVRVIGDGDNHWPLVYERDLGELYLRLATNPDGLGDLPRQRRGGRDRQRDRRRASASTREPSRASATSRSPKRGRRWGRTPRRWPSTRASAARAPARSAGHRRCIPSPATRPGCSKNGGESREAASRASHPAAT